MSDGFGKSMFKLLLLLILLAATGFASYKAVLSIWGKDVENKVTNTTNVGIPDQSTEKEAAIQSILSTAIMYDDVSAQNVEYSTVRFFNVNTKEMNMIFIPANIEVSLSNQTYQTLKNASSHIKQKMSLKKIGSYFAKDSDRYRYTALALGDLLNVRIQNYEVISSDNASRIVNLIDPVEYNVPFKMTFKDSSDINVVLKKGTQTLIGDQVKGMLTIPKLYDTEEERLKVNKGYLKAYFTKLYGQKNHDLLGAYYQNYFSLISSNTNFDKMKYYLDYFYQITEKDIHMYILPGEWNGSKFSIDKNGVKKLVKDFTKEAVKEPTTEKVTTEKVATTKEEATTEEATTTEKATTEKTTTQKATTEKATTEAPKDSKNLKIEIINSTRVAGLAARWKSSLGRKGYKVVHTDTDWNNHRTSAEIYVSQKGQGEDLLKYFPKAKIIVKKPAGADIQIVLGTEQRVVK